MLRSNVKRDVLNFAELRKALFGGSSNRTNWTDYWLYKVVQCLKHIPPIEF